MSICSVLDELVPGPRWRARGSHGVGHGDLGVALGGRRLRPVREEMDLEPFAVMVVDQSPDRLHPVPPGEVGRHVSHAKGTVRRGNPVREILAARSRRQALRRPGAAAFEDLLVSHRRGSGDDHGHVGQGHGPGLGGQVVEGSLERLERRIDLPQLIQGSAQVVMPLAVIGLELHEPARLSAAEA